MSLNTSAELVSEIVEEAVHHIGRKVGDREIRMVMENDFLLIRADVRLLVQVVINLLDNAVKYTSEDAQITVSAGRKGNYAEICVSDTGKGIPDEEKEKIFEKFYCGENKIADNRRSIGLGLYLCKAIVEAHGGMIRVLDNQPHGARFCFTIPLEEVKIYE